MTKATKAQEVNSKNLKEEKTMTKQTVKSNAKEIKKLEEAVNMEKATKEIKAIEEIKEKIEVLETEFEKSLKILRNTVTKNPELKLVEQEAKTGFSYFSGKTRLCKLLKTKRGVTLELNVKLPKKYDDTPGLQNITAAIAYKKHLGTMKHLYKGGDASLINSLIKAAIEELTLIVIPQETKEAKAK